MKRPGPAASCTMRASMATWTGCRVKGEMIPQPIVSRSVSRAISAETTVDERASIPCLRHHGYASASQIVSMPASSIARADASISSSGSMVSCITPTRKGTATRRRLAPGFRRTGDRGLHLAVERGDHLRDLLGDDRLEHPLPHRADRARDLDVGVPVHRGAAVGVAQRERRDHAHHRADDFALDVELRELGFALLGLVHVDLHPQAAEAERDLDIRRPVLRVVDVEALDAGHRLRHRGRIVEHAPHRVARCSEVAVTVDVHASLTVTFAPALPSSISQTRWYGFALSQTIASPFPRSASCTAAQTA